MSWATSKACQRKREVEIMSVYEDRMESVNEAGSTEAKLKEEKQKKPEDP